MREQFKPRQISPTEIRVWENLVSSQYQLKISTLGRKWRFRFLLETLPIPKSAVIATICLGDCFGTIQCKLLPTRWLREILRGPSVETLVEPFRSAVVAVLLQDFFSKLSEVSQLPIRLIESPPLLEEGALFTLYWEMANDYDEPEIIGSLTAEEGLITQVQAVATTWPVVPRKLPESLKISADVLVGFLSLSQGECSCLEVGDILLIGPVERWRQGNFLLRVFQGRQPGLLIPINPTHSNNEEIPPLMRYSEKYSKSDKDDLGPEALNYQTPNNEVRTPTTAREAQWLDDAEVTLEFSLGRQNISLGELRRMGQGHYFPIHARADCLVNILLQGKSIGRGELIQVGEEVGILVREFGFEKANPTSQTSAVATMSEEASQATMSEEESVTRE
ncbi:type III secretion system protein SpaO [Candidatus Xiphinematobacter sp. Idaho Grape]|uniref:FliM/FliN family flagellar motor switch protein n=1 Tax=Candidatus Xiphinematobacter sp. Idaho Grape TaxID=1704307 RepID=UPI000706C972|nr:FliM/FliN family flagellar motor switch protein [Candidatus Xiphinematobacter sp. Idaho Grape]ALJ56897.1 type III secretion system protein SpaO [Candidatus Xiphinematobacter sp. Idaho Grape]